MKIDWKRSIIASLILIVLLNVSYKVFAEDHAATCHDAMLKLKYELELKLNKKLLAIIEQCEKKKGGLLIFQDENGNKIESLCWKVTQL